MILGMSDVKDGHGALLLTNKVTTKQISNQTSNVQNYHGLTSLCLDNTAIFKIKCVTAISKVLRNTYEGHLKSSRNWLQRVTLWRWNYFFIILQFFGWTLAKFQLDICPSCVYIFSYIQGVPKRGKLGKLFKIITFEQLDHGCKFFICSTTVYCTNCLKISP